jgi:hypothetical protein
LKLSYTEDVAGSSPIPKVFQLDMPDRFLSVERESDLP